MSLPRSMSQKVRAASSLLRDVINMARKGQDVASVLRYAADVVLVRIRACDDEREIRLRPGVRVRYRLNRGDIQSIREVWLDDAYRLPVIGKSEVLVDLGANIGLTSLWLAKQYGFRTVIAVEPSQANARLTKRNLEQNGIAAEVIEAAVGPTDGTVFFDDAEASNVGRVAKSGRPVRMLSMATVMSRLAPTTDVDLVKLDIEGGEEALLQGDLKWLTRVRTLIAEFHPDIIDYPKAIESIRRSGFRYFPPGSAHKDSMDFFARM